MLFNSPEFLLFSTDRLRTVLVRRAAQSQGAEHAARHRELCVLRVVGLAILGADCVFHFGGLPRGFADRRSTGETRQEGLARGFVVGEPGAAVLLQVQQLFHRQLGRSVGFGGRDDARVVAQGDLAGGHQLLYVSDPLLFH